MKNRIKVERAELDMTQADLADKIGVSRQSINAIEKGKFVPSAVLALKIALKPANVADQSWQVIEFSTYLLRRVMVPLPRKTVVTRGRRCAALTRG